MHNLDNLMHVAGLAVTVFLLLSVGSVCHADLVAFWHFEEPSGSLVADSVNGHHGTATADVVPSTDRPALLYSNTGSRSFPGNTNGGHIEVPDHSDLDLTGDFTLEAWIKAWRPGEAPKILAKHRYKMDNDGSWALELGLRPGQLGFLRLQVLSPNYTLQGSKFPRVRS